jgi:hypothetical protein
VRRSLALLSMHIASALLTLTIPATAQAPAPAQGYKETIR